MTTSAMFKGMCWCTSDKDGLDLFKRYAPLYRERPSRVPYVCPWCALPSLMCPCCVLCAVEGAPLAPSWALEWKQ